MANMLTNTARELLEIERDLPFRFDYTNEKPLIDNFEMYTFMQTWGSTALGFSGIGGQSITSARTYVFVPLECNQKCFVYFAGRFAYAVDFCDRFREDLKNQNMAAVYEIGRYYKRNNV